MTRLPKWFTAVLEGFAPLFSARIWPQVQLLVVGALLSPGKRTVTAALRVLGLADDPRFGTFHRLLNRARWSSLQASRVLLGLLLMALVPSGPLVLGLDDTIERRTGAKISAKGIYRDPVRSSHGHFVKASGLRWLSLMLLTPIPWAHRIWALPFLTALVPSQRYHEERGHRHKTLTDWARRMLRLVQRWCPGRPLIVVADGAYASIAWLHDLQQGQPITVITRLRLDAALYDPASERGAGQMGRPRLKGNRLPTLASLLQDPETRWERVQVGCWYGENRREVEIVSRTAVWYHTGLPPLPVRWALIRDPKGRCSTQALLCTDLLQTPIQILEHFVQRWQLEVTVEEVRAHLGVETQRQWTDLAIARTTPALLGLFSLVTLMAHERWKSHDVWVRRAAWYDKTLPTFVDALAEVRRALWKVPTFRTSAPEREMVQVPLEFIERLTDALCYAA
ncbi:transposase [Deinococcus sp. Arct2-2]|uniref:IS701 family transposase n=1 Tax=Deinococcus sp. Arct2-2 TaxID=2568653 RepID=UPI0010A4F145|nr:transposase [Deinococcus sp. Arct2-2]THF69133.1 transposase [Deinococcus sp. Arct2-2]